MYFSHKKALDGVTLDFCAGEIHSLLGENGAGKSTLAHILSGRTEPTSGTIHIDNKSVRFLSPKDAIKNGICMVHQNPALAEHITIWENILLAQHTHQFFRKKHTIQTIAAFCQKQHIELDITKPVYKATAQERFYTAFVSALIKNPQFLILDEPSSVLNKEQYRSFLLYMNSFVHTQEGRGVVYITHNIEEAVQISSKITLLQHGKAVKTFSSSQEPLSASEIIRELYGELPKQQEVQPLLHTPDEHIPKTALQVRNLITTAHERAPLHSIDISAAFSRITIIKGEKASGIETLEDILTGMYTRRYFGMVSINGIDIKPLTATELRHMKVGIVPSDKYMRGSNPAVTVKELLLPFAGKKEESLHGSLDAFVRGIIQAEKIDINPDEPAANLSGGMLQRLILARELALRPRILILANPLHGLDRKTVLEVDESLRLAADSGTAVIILTSDKESDYISHDAIYTIADGRIQLQKGESL